MLNEHVGGLSPSQILESRGLKLRPHQREVLDRIQAIHARSCEQVGTGGPSKLQEEVLRRFAEKHGRTWKSRLMNSWLKGTDDRLADGGVLRQIRNELGSQWLRSYRIVSQ